MRTARQMRDGYLDYFRELEHAVVPSASTVPRNDPTLLFTNAGMNQFKDVFLGTGTRPYVRAADTQKCVRVDGKHNDLEEVGYSKSHHTFFEMLGNWSFGDYFKREAIQWAWELLTDVWGLPKDRLYVTVFGGDEADGVAADNEAADLWAEVTDIDSSHILPFGKKDNFWEMGDTGPCGPCSEIHIDMTPEGTGGAMVNSDDPNVIEIWNLVFIQFNRQADSSLVPLPAKHVDTGMGFERVCAIMQGKTSNYETDLFTPLLERISELSGKGYANGDEQTIRIPMQVISDHARMLTFTIGDGALPGNEGRGYVLRRILRRAVRYGRMLGFDDPFLYKLTPVLVDSMGYIFPEIVERQEHIERVIRAEEEAFGRTLDRGLEIFEEVASGLGKDNGAQFPGDEAFKLYDTFGFPLDLTQLISSERGLDVDTTRFDELMTEQRERARSAQRFAVDLAAVALWQDVSEGEHSFFTGYASVEEEAAIRRVRVLEGPDDAKIYHVVLDRTPFYGESGGQVGDQGTLTVGDDKLTVLDTRKEEDDSIVHVVDRLPADLEADVVAQVDVTRRTATRRAHSATHLLHAGLRKYLGTHVTQAGSLVAPDRVRFDVTHYEGISDSVIADVEAFVNEHVLAGEDVETNLMGLEEARERGAMALFGEKYGDRVRTVVMGDTSMELCGGTHVANTAAIGPFKVLREASIASGVRRIDAVTGHAAFAHYAESDRLVEGVASVVGARRREELLDRAEHIVGEVKRLEGEAATLRAQAALSNVDAYLDAAKDVDGVKVLAAVVENIGCDELRELGEALKEKIGSGVVVLGAEVDGRPAIIVGVTEDVIKSAGVKAGDVVKAVAGVAGGGGGGRPEFAQAGGGDVSKLAAAIEAVDEIVARQISA
jgi:alanyl-tRNA synthetase